MLQMEMIVKKSKNLESPYIRISLANALRTITILLYPDYLPTILKNTFTSINNGKF